MHERAMATNAAQGKGRGNGAGNNRLKHRLKHIRKTCTATAPAFAFKNYQSKSLPLIVAPFCFAFSF